MLLWIFRFIQENVQYVRNRAGVFIKCPVRVLHPQGDKHIPLTDLSHTPTFPKKRCVQSHLGKIRAAHGVTHAFHVDQTAERLGNLGNGGSAYTR